MEEEEIQTEVLEDLEEEAVVQAEQLSEELVGQEFLAREILVELVPDHLEADRGLEPEVEVQQPLEEAPPFITMAERAVMVH